MSSNSPAAAIADLPYGVLGQKLAGFRKKWPISEIAFISEFKFEMSALKLTHLPNFSQVGQMIKEPEFLPRPLPETASWRHNHTIVTLFNIFERLCPRVLSCQVWW